jgi:hypothetical protein
MKKGEKMGGSGDQKKTSKTSKTGGGGGMKNKRTRIKKPKWLGGRSKQKEGFPPNDN